jgi:cystathionine beta-lyase/cystathionine gamma-synthase
MKDKISTLLCHDDDEYFKHQGAIVPPIYQNSLFAFEDWDAIDRAFENNADSFIYSRLMNPTAELAEKKIAMLCGGEKAKLCASGMGAISAAIMSCVKAGDHVITVTNVYGPANNFLNVFLKEKCNVELSYVSGVNIAEFEEAIHENTSLIYLESPSSMTFELQDISAVAALAKSKGIKTIIDNTWASPLFQQPLAMGIDIEVHSVSKYLCGHSDVVAGAVIARKAEIDKIIVTEHALLGAKVSPFEAWLILRSLRTLPLRMAQHDRTVRQIADFLDNHPRVRKVNFPGLKSFPQYDLACRQMSGWGALLSIELDTDDLVCVKTFVNSLRLFKLGVSWGGHESLVYSPSISYAKELPPDKFAAMGIKVGLIRLSLGLENPEDLQQELALALENLG